MSIQHVSNALKHVHGNLDVENQWTRARVGLENMTELEKAQVWTILSSHTLTMEQQKAAVVLSQYRTLYKAAIKKEIHEAVNCTAQGSEDTLKLLKEYKVLLNQYNEFMQSFQIIVNNEDKETLILELKSIIDNAALLKDLKTEIKETLDTAMATMAKSEDVAKSTAKQTDLESKITEIKQAISNLNETFNLKTEDIHKTIQNEFQGILSRQETKQQQIDSKMINTMEVQETLLSESIQKITIQLQTMNTNQIDIAEIIQSQNTKHDDSSAALRIKLKSLEDRTTKLNELFMEHSSLIQSTMKDQKDNIDTKIDQLKSDLSNIVESLKTLQNQSLTATEELRSNVSSNSEKIVYLQNQFTDTKAGINSIKTEIKGVSAYIDEFNKERSDLTKAIQSMTESFGTRLDGIEERFETTESRELPSEITPDTAHDSGNDSSVTITDSKRQPRKSNKEMNPYEEDPRPRHKGQLSPTARDNRRKWREEFQPSDPGYSFDTTL